MAINENDFIGFGPAVDNAGARHTINHLPETEEWEDEIYQIETGDYVVGGGNGVANLQPRQLANRTAYLKKKIQELREAMEAIQPGTDKYDEIMALINSLDANTANNRLNHLERLVGNAYLAFEMANIDPDGYDGMIIETFDGRADEIDQTVANVLSLVSGDDSVDVDDSDNLIIGAHYQLTDGEKLEEVQIKSINISGSIKRVILEENIRNQYNVERAKLYRSSVALSNGRAYGGGNKQTQTLDVNQTWHGSDTIAELSSTVDYSDATSFVLKGAYIENGVIVMGSPAIGIVINAMGGTANGTNWQNVNADGEKLKQTELV